MSDVPVPAAAPAAQKKTPAQVAADWWRGLQRTRSGGSPNAAADPGALARLRRAAKPLDALAETQAIALARQLQCRPDQGWRIEAIAVLAIVLAHVREDAGERRRVTLGELLGGEAPVMSDLRLRRLLAARDAEELMRGLREAVALLGGAAPVIDLAKLTLGWLDPDRGDAIRTRFLFDYHGASDAAPPERDGPDAA